MAADVALEGLVEAVTAHVDGEHDVVQEEDVTVEAVEGAHGTSIPVQHLHGLHGGEEGAGTLFDQGGGDGTGSLPLGVLGLAGAGRGMAAAQAWGVVVEVVAVGGTDLGWSPCALLLGGALRVRGVGAAVGRSGVAVAVGLLIASQRHQTSSTVSLGALSKHVAVAQNGAQQEGGVERRQRRRLVVLLFPPVHMEGRSSKRSSGLRAGQVLVLLRARGQFTRGLRQFKLHLLFTCTNDTATFTFGLMYANTLRIFSSRSASSLYKYTIAVILDMNDYDSKT